VIPKPPRSQLDALSEAVSAVTSELSLERVLRRLAEISAQMVNARYAALGVPNDSGGLAQFYTYGMTDAQISRMDHLPLGLGLLGKLLQVEQPIRLEDMRSDASSAGFCPAHPRMTSFLGVPVISKGRHLGSLYLSDRIDHQPFSEEDERLVSLLAGHAAIAIENAKLSERLQRLAIMEERDRIAMELHDGIIQQIYAVGLKLEIARRASPPAPELDQQLTHVNADLNRVIEDLRKYIGNLVQGVEITVSLQEQIREIAEAFRNINSASLVAEVSQSFNTLTEDKVHAITQIAREALSNIVRHSGATQVYLSIAETRGVLEMRIEDDGRGFDAETIRRGNGLNNMQNRAGQLGGTLTLESAPDHGAMLVLALPGDSG
jgi:signal transduction histidine kinase